MKLARTHPTGRPASLGRALSDAVAAHAAARPAAAALVDVGTGNTLTWRDLDVESAVVAASIEGGAGSTLAAFVDATASRIAALVGAMRTDRSIVVLPPDAPAGIAAQVIGDQVDRGATVVPARAIGRDAGEGLWLLSGGSTGAPKLLESTFLRSDPFLVPYPARLVSRLAWQPGAVQLVVAPPHHAAGLLFLVEGLVAGNTLVLQDRFAPRLLMDAVADLGVEWMHLLPHQMRRIERAGALAGPALGRLRGIVHTSAPCPPSTKLAWLDAVGDDRVFEMYGATEGIGATVASGAEWRARPGTVGRGFFTQVRIEGPGRAPVPPGREGRVMMRSARRRPGIEYSPDGFATVNDRGHVDDDGYLYLAPREVDLLVVGGANVRPEAVEAVLLSHAGVLDAAVVGVPDERFGSRVCAVIVADAGFDPASLRAWCRPRLPREAIPRQLVVVDALARTSAGKLDRVAIRDDVLARRVVTA